MPIFADKDPQGRLTGKWRATIRIKGRTIRSTRFDTHEEAKLWVREQKQDEIKRFKENFKMPTFLAEKKRSVSPARPKLTFGELYLKGTGAIWRGDKSEANMELRFRILVNTIGPDVYVEDMTTRKVDELINKLYKRKKGSRPIQGSTVNRYLSILRSAMVWALEREYIDEIPVVAWQNENTGRIRWITEEEEARLYDLLPELYARLVRVALKTGMRRGELLSLTYDQIKSDRVYLWETKNDEPRPVYISGETHADLMWLLDHGMPSESALRYAWDRARAEMGLSRDTLFVFHVCRHTCCMRLIEAGVNLRVIQKWLGHKTIETTIRYAQVRDEMLKDALTKMEALSSRGQQQVGLTHVRSIGTPEMIDFEHSVSEGFDLTKQKDEQYQRCGRGGTGRRAGFRSSQDDDNSE